MCLLTLLLLLPWVYCMLARVCSVGLHVWASAPALARTHSFSLSLFKNCTLSLNAWFLSIPLHLDLSKQTHEQHIYLCILCTTYSIQHALVAWAHKRGAVPWHMSHARARTPNNIHSKHTGAHRAQRQQDCAPHRLALHITCMYSIIYMLRIQDAILRITIWHARDGVLFQRNSEQLTELKTARRHVGGVRVVFMIWKRTTTRLLHSRAVLRPHRETQCGVYTHCTCTHIYIFQTKARIIIVNRCPENRHPSEKRMCVSSGKSKCEGARCRGVCVCVCITCVLWMRAIHGVYGLALSGRRTEAYWGW